MRVRLCLCVMTVFLAMASAPVTAQMAAAEPPVDQELEEVLQQLGAPPEIQMMFQLMNQGDMDPMMLMMLMGMADGGGMDEGFLFFMLMQNSMKGAQATGPEMLVHGEKLIIVEEGIAYKIDLGTLAIEGQIEYKPKKKPDLANFLRMLGPMIGGAQGDPAANVAVNNVKQLGLAAHQYAADFDETLPGDDWINALLPYLQNDQVLRNPARPELTFAYALNQDVAGLALADIPDPSRTVLFFGSDTAEQAPIAGADALSVTPEGSAIIGFVDGHVQVIPIDQALQNLIWNPLEQ